LKKPEELSENMENYLEVIHDLEKTNKVARGKDIADRLNIQRASVSGALKILKDKGLVNYDPYSYVTLTPKGKAIARNVAHRHTVIRDFLHTVLQVDNETAESTACRMEHAIDEKTLDRLVSFIQYIHLCPRAGEQWLEAFLRFCQTQDHDGSHCSQCINNLKISND